MEWLEKYKFNDLFINHLFFLFLLFIIRSTVGIGNVASVVVGGGDEDKLVVGLLDEEEVETLFGKGVIVAIGFNIRKTI
jgi:hypothetical protein